MTIMAQHGFKVPEGLDLGEAQAETLNLMKSVLCAITGGQAGQSVLGRLRRDDLQRVLASVTHVASGQPATPAEVGTIYAMTLKTAVEPEVLESIRSRNAEELDHLHCHSLDLGADFVDAAMRRAMAALKVTAEVDAELDEAMGDFQLDAFQHARNTFLGGREAPDQTPGVHAP